MINFCSLPVIFTDLFSLQICVTRSIFLATPGPEVIELEYSLRLKIRHMIGCLRTRVRKQPIIALYIESENLLKFYNLEAWSRGYKIWVHSQNQNKVQRLAACGQVSASSQSLRFIPRCNRPLCLTFESALSIHSFLLTSNWMGYLFH